MKAIFFDIMIDYSQKKLRFLSKKANNTKFFKRT